MLDIPAALARQEPVRDAGEPNDDVRLVKPGGLFASGSLPLTSRAKGKASLRATLDVARIRRICTGSGCPPAAA